MKYSKETILIKNIEQLKQTIKDRSYNNYELMVVDNKIMIKGVKCSKPEPKAPKWFTEFANEVRVNFNKVNNRLDNVEDILERHSQILECHSQILERHSQILEHHSQILERHDQILERHDQILKCNKLK